MFNLHEFNKNTIIKDNNPKIREKSKNVEFPLNVNNKMLLAKMIKYLIDSNDEEVSEEKNLEPALGLAAIQVGSAVRIFVMLDLELGQVVGVINPKIKKKSKKTVYLEDGEGCLSVPKKKEGYVHRSETIEVEYYDIEGKKIKKKYNDMQAIIFQHEYDHLDGKLYTDYINEDDPFFIKKNSHKIE